MSCLPAPPKCISVILHASTQRRTKNTAKKPTNPRTKPRNTQDGKRTTTTEKKKKTGAGRGRGVGVEHEVRVEVGERVREEENTRGTPNPPKGVWVSPAPERKRRKEKTRRRRNQPDTRKEEGHIQKAKHGSGLEGLKIHNKYQPQRQKRETNNQRTKTKT